MNSKPIICLICLSLWACSGQERQVSPPRQSANSELSATVTTVESKPQPENFSQSSEEETIKQTIIEPSKLPLHLLQTGRFHGYEVQATSGEKWMGLFVTPKGFEFLPTTIAVISVHDPILDGKKTEKTGKQVMTDQKLDSIFLVKGSVALKPGTVKTVFFGWAELIPHSSGSHPALSLSLDASQSYGVYGISLEETMKNGKKNYALSISQGVTGEKQKIQLFARCCDMTYPRLLWAGDLDRDDKLDLLVDITNHYNVSQPILFLSSLAKNGNLVEPVAEFRSVGC